MKIAVENGKICNKTTMGERLSRISEVWIVDEKESFRLDSVKKTERIDSSMFLLGKNLSLLNHS